MGELNTRLTTADNASPERWLMVLHGIYGAGRNWGSVARGLVSARPEWGAVLVDMREHGESSGFAEPHTIEATAGDLEAVDVPGRIRAVLGHSFGGKIALLRARDDEAVEQVWVVDSTPEAREPEGGAWEMLQVLRRMPEQFQDRDEAVRALEASGVARPIAVWMTTNLERTDDTFRWAIDLDTMEALLRDFFRADLWELVESPRDGVELHFIRATESPVLGLAQADRIRAAGRRTGRVFVHDVQGGHWLNGDNPDALVELIGARLP
jgi:pimeloyl-ACP methyl ester carboxylesterase